MINEYMKKRAEALIAENVQVVNFGSKDDFVGPALVGQAEDAIGFKFPKSYRWFLENYSGGEIGSEEIFSVYEGRAGNPSSGDIAYQHAMRTKNGVTRNDHVVVCHTDYGEIFFFDFSTFSDGECCIKLRRPSGHEDLYANNFYEFICKRIIEHI